MKIQVGAQTIEEGGEIVATRLRDGNVRVGSGDRERIAHVAGDQVWIDGRVRRVRVVASAAAAVIPDRVTPPMPATVVKVLVEVGDTVERGAKLVTVTAMKMETALRSPRAGVVTAVNVTPGQQVRPGEELVVIGEGA